MTLLQLGLFFGQVNQQPPQGGDAAGALFACFCYGIVIAVALIIQILFLLNLSRCLAECAPRNRTMEPGMVWLNLIPLFNLVWIFITIIRLSESLQNEYRSRGMHPDDPDFGKLMGILYAVFSIVGCFPINLIFFIIYWVKMANYKNELIANRGSGGDYADERGEEDDRPRREPRRRDEDEDDRDDRRRRDDDY